VELITHDLAGETRGAIASIMKGLFVVIGKVKARWDVSCVLSFKAGKGQLLKVGAQVLFRFIEVAALEVVTDNVHV